MAARKSGGGSAIETSPVLSRAVAHYQGSEVRHIDVPEWADEHGEPTRVYWRPATLGEEGQIRANYEQHGSREGLIVDTIIARALDADGGRMFTVADKPGLLKSADGQVLSAIYLAMTTGTGVQAQEKNS